MYEILVNSVFASQINKNFSPSPTKSHLLDLCSCSCGDQVILLATVDYSVFLLLLLLFGGVYHKKYVLHSTFYMSRLLSSYNKLAFHNPVCCT